MDQQNAINLSATINYYISCCGVYLLVFLACCVGVMRARIKKQGLKSANHTEFNHYYEKES